MVPFSDDFFETLLAQARARAADQYAPSTGRAYARAFKQFARWCTEAARTALPATDETVAVYVMTLSKRGLCAASCAYYVAGIAAHHRAAGHPSPIASPLVEGTLLSLRRTDTHTRKQARAFAPDDVRRLVDAQERTRGALWQVRNRAMILLGFAGALRRSEIVGLDVADCRFHHDGRAVTITIRRSKTDREARGQKVTIPALKNAYCPVAALRAWLEERPSAFVRGEDPSGALFLSPRGARVESSTFYRHFLTWCRTARLYGFTPHSLRAGFVTSAYLATHDEQAIRAVTRHRSHDTYLSYVRPLESLERAPLARVGL